MVTLKSSHRLIVRDPRIHGGEPVVHGTRVPVRSIILSLRDDHPGDLPSVAEAYRIDPAAVEAALAYYRTHTAEIDRFIEDHDRVAYDG